VTQAGTDAPAYLYTIAWVGLLVIFGTYAAVGVVLRWRPRHLVQVTRYTPPDGISPAVAACLMDSGRCERAFAAALVSLAVKGYVRISQNGSSITLEALRIPDGQLPPEEIIVHKALLPNSAAKYSFNGTDSFWLFASYQEFRTTIHNVVTPKWMTTHVVIWLVGLCYSITVLEPIVFATPKLGHGMPLASVGFAGILIFVGASTFVAALRVWPALLRKLGTFLPGSQGARRPLNMNDAIPPFLTVTAAFGFMLLSVVTSTKLAGFLAGALAMNVLSWHFLNGPTSAGRKVLAELSAYREFLRRTETDRLNRENSPGRTPEKLDLHEAYAVALSVPCGWGEEFAVNILDLVQVDEAYNPPVTIPEPDTSPRILTLFGRNK
jgi:hypothetical protein